MIIGTSLRGAINDQQPLNAVKNLQKTLNAIAGLLGNADYSVPVDGTVGWREVKALYSLAEDGVEEIPVINAIWANLKKIPGVGYMLNRNSIQTLWNIAKYEYEQEMYDNIVKPLRDAAVTINSKLQSRLDKLKAGGSTQLQPGTKMGVLLPTAVTYPPGTVGVRDPILGKFRLIAPPLK